MEYWVTARKPVTGHILFLARVLSVVFFGLIVVAVMSAPADAANRRVYAGIVLDAKTGKTLYAHDSEAIRYPASVTKVMTLYILFQELDAGRLSLDSKMKVSRHAAAAVPTKLGLPPGSTIRVRDAIGAIVTLSANDIARVIAERISGSESKFAVRMTKTAKALGMVHTHYDNASGLPDSGQVTTVRDQARLAMAMLQHFPQYYKYFSTRVFKYKGRSYGNHNHLLGDYGVDGLKTGYINAAGYNLLTSAKSGDRRVVVAAFGFNTSGSRDAKVASLVKTYLPKARNGPLLAQARVARPGSGGEIRLALTKPVHPHDRPAFLYAAASPMPQPMTARDAIALAAIEPEQTMPRPPQPMPAPAYANGSQTLGLLPASALDAARRVADSRQPVPQPQPANIVGAWVSKSARLDGSAMSGPTPPASIGSGGNAGTIDLLTSGAVSDPARTDSWVVQIGATPDESGARGLLDRAVSTVGDLADFRSFVETTTRDGQTLYRARFSGFGDRDQARRMCDRIKQKDMSCLAMQS